MDLRNSRHGSNHVLLGPRPNGPCPDGPRPKIYLKHKQFCLSVTIEIQISYFITACSQIPRIEFPIETTILLGFPITRIVQKKKKREKIKPLPRFRHSAAIEYNNDQKYFEFVERQKIFTTCTVLHFIKQLGSTEKLVCTCTNSFNVLSNLRNNKSKRNLLRSNSQYCFSDKRLLLSGDIELNPGPSAKNTCSSDKLITTNVILENRLDELGLRPLDVGGEGDCFFRAISHQLYNDSSHHLDIRASGVQYMRESPERFIESNVEFLGTVPYKYVYTGNMG